ncbi:PIK3AP1 family protein [Megaselia abdita]
MENPDDKKDYSTWMTKCFFFFFLFTDNCGGSSNMDDILIVTAKHSERAILWANFLKSRFDKITKQRGRKPFNFLHIRIDDGACSPDVAQKCKNTALQIIILCPALLALPHHFLFEQLTAILNIEKILGILLDVKEQSILDIHKTALPSYRRWRRCAVRDNDQSLIGNILGIATDILGRALCQRPLCNDASGQIKSLNSTDGCFTLVPKKVKIGQNKVLALFNEPLEKGDDIKITIENSGEIIEAINVKQRNPYTIQFSIPETCMEISTMLDVNIDKNDIKIGNRPIKCESRVRELEILLRTQDTPLEFMCQSLGIGTADKDNLDIHLLECFQRNLPRDYHLLHGHYEQKHSHAKNLFSSMKMRSFDSSPEEYPTLLHFAAKWGFERLCMQLIECPGGEEACSLRNSQGRTPSQIADQEGFTKLASSIKGYAQMHEFTNMFNYFKGMSADVITHNATIENTPKQQQIFKQFSQENNEIVSQGATCNEYMEMHNGKNHSLAVSNLNYMGGEDRDEVDGIKVVELESESEPDVKTNELKINEPPYYQSNEQNKKRQISADKFSQECLNLLENCQTTADYVLPSRKPPMPEPSNYLYPTNNTLVPLAPSDEPDYMNDPSTPLMTNEDSGFARVQIEKKNSASFVSLASNRYNSNGNGTLKRTCSNASSTAKSNADDDLAEIMYDFKNNILTIKEVEELVADWKNRNDVKQSYVEKQEQIEKMRATYEKIQEQMKCKLKRDTPFEKFKKLFTRQKSDTDPIDPMNETSSSLMSYQSNNSHRPNSLHSVSSSSSGRLSTGSGTSLGDSGTHSDLEERRGNSFSSCRVGSPGSLMDNYLVPPSNPRPVLTPLSTPIEDQVFFGKNMASPTSSSEHYLMFPSNIPVSQSSGYLNTIMEAKEYCNQPSIQQIKVERTPNIIYGKLQKTNPRDFCSSFKPAPGKQVPSAKSTSSVDDQNYQNIDDDIGDDKHNYINC